MYDHGVYVPCISYSPKYYNGGSWWTKVQTYAVTFVLLWLVYDVNSPMNPDSSMYVLGTSFLVRLRLVPPVELFSSVASSCNRSSFVSGVGDSGSTLGSLSGSTLGSRIRLGTGLSSKTSISETERGKHLKYLITFPHTRARQTWTTTCDKTDNNV